MKTVTINKEQKVYIIPCGNNGYSGLGFKVAKDRNDRLRLELGLPTCTEELGTMALYNSYMEAIQKAKDRNAINGYRCKCELHPRLIGLEGKKIEATYYDERIRFTVGKSTGFIPCHLVMLRGKFGEAISCDSDLGAIAIIK